MLTLNVRIYFYSFALYCWEMLENKCVAVFFSDRLSLYQYMECRQKNPESSQMTEYGRTKSWLRMGFWFRTFSFLAFSGKCKKVFTFV